jgi:sterol desaturase/sphingolipid hydroxylase (fatty acid hydroxylase superfamily)
MDGENILRLGAFIMNCNFGFNFPWRDRLFSNYQIQPASGHENMPLGLKIFRNAR